MGADMIAATAADTLVFFVNGKKVVDANADPEWTLLYYLRNKLRLCGTKLGCAEGGCGACTVMVSRIVGDNKIQHLAVNACLAPVCSMHGLAVTTVEGIGSTKSQLHPIQERLAKSHGSQCGFCTPGIVMSMYALLRTSAGSSGLTMQQLEVAFQGNLCRCTGYRPIIESFKSFLCEDWETKGRYNGETAVCGAGEACCRNKSNTFEEKIETINDFTPYDSSQEVIFPPELQLCGGALDREFLRVKGERMTWFRPVTIQQLLELKAEFPHARIAVGNTEVGVEVKFKNCFYEVVIQPSQVNELTLIETTQEGLKLGAAVTLSDMESALQTQIETQPESKTKIFVALVKMLDLFAGKQIRNVAGIGGNIMTGSPISDLNPIFLAANCVLELRSRERGSRSVRMEAGFFTGYRQNVVLADEILVSITIPYSTPRQFFLAYKQAKRRDDDIAIVNAAFNLTLNEQNEVKALAMAFGGMAATTLLASHTANKLIGRKWDESLLECAYDLLSRELILTPEAPGGMVQFRQSLTLGFFFKFYLSVLDLHRNTTRVFQALTTKSAQYFQINKSGDERGVGISLQHVSSDKQATGEAVYCDDLPPFEGELYLTLVLSTRAHASIVSVDATKALALKGVVAFFSAKDLNNSKNQHGTIKADEQVFADTKVTCQGQVIGAVVAHNQLLSQRAAKLVNVQYQDLQPIIVTIQDAVRENSFFSGYCPRLVHGDITEGFQESDHVIYGETHMGGQEHFYLETQCAVAVPSENELQIFCSTQNPAEIQRAVSHMLGLPQNRVVCRAKRLGGGFGGKESRATMLALPVALAASRLNRSVRCMLDRDEDMVMTGGRNPFHSRYKVGFAKNGLLKACQMTIYNNAGNTLDLSSSVMERAVFHMDNAYKIAHVEAQGYVCKTNLPSNTAFRGFGGPQAMFMAENYIEDVAAYLQLDPAQVRRANLYQEGDTTHYNQVLSHCTLQACWDECLRKSDYFARKNTVEHYNSENRYKKKGISILPTKFGIAFTAKFLNQSGALVHIYLDGSVLISHGGVEMGQGLHTKMIQVASTSLGVCDADIHISETSTDKVPNTSPSAASATSDLNGMAVLEACKILNARLEPYKKSNPEGTWKQWVTSAYFDRVSLSATGYYSTPDIGFDWKSQSGNPFNYFTYGVACSEVEIDCLTGDHQVLRSDIVMDLGESLNPAIDIGQIEGGFVQGYGLFTLEEVVYSPKGTLYSRGPGMYKLPGFTDIPAEFNVSLLRGAPNPRAVYSSKAVGEPPLFLAASVFFAIKAAISSARRDVGLSGPFRLDSPATAARIRMACADHITAKFPEGKCGTFTPWNVEP